MIDGLVGHKGLYPARSELIRVAIRDFLIRELSSAKSFANYATPLQTPPPVIATPDVDPGLFVQIPLGSASNGIPEYKTFRLVKKESRPAMEEILPSHIAMTPSSNKAANMTIDEGGLIFPTDMPIPLEKTAGHL
jgi:hypothetical protein